MSQNASNRVYVGFLHACVCMSEQLDDGSTEAKEMALKRQAGTPQEGPGGSGPGVAPPAPPQHTLLCSQTLLLICPADMTTG